jgi:manganese transport system ATP-binding protein
MPLPFVVPAAGPLAPLVPAPAGLDRITVTGLWAGYGDGPVLQGLDLQLAAGSICALVGSNGAGKSTLFRCLMGFLAPSRGTLRIDGLPLAEAQRRQRVAYVPQSEEVDWQFPIQVRDVVMMGRYGHMNLLRWPAASDRAAVEAALERLELLPLARRQIGALSGGQRKRTFLARALAQQAGVLLLDEPFSGVDARTEALIRGQLLDLRDAGGSVLIASHDLAGIPGFCDRVLLLQGRIIADGPPATVLAAQRP